MNFYDCLRRFKLLSGLEGEELSRFSELCHDAAAELRASLAVPEQSLTEAESLRLSYAAGALAYYKYCLYLLSSEPETFEAGEVKVINKDKKSDGARKLFEAECRGLRGVLRDREFYFGRVKS